MEGKINNYFLGANAPGKFYSLFGEAINLKTANRVFYLKGGPGTGKSTLMKNIGNHYQSLGYDLDYFHCSSDCNSIDCVLIKKLKVAIFDGTAPHILDPKYPGSIDEIVDLSLNWDESSLINSREDIIKCQDNLSIYYNRCFSYLNCCELILTDMNFIFKKAIKADVFTNISNNLIKSIFSFNKVNKVPKTIEESRDLFITAFTPQGTISYISELMEKSSKVYMLKGYTEKNHILQLIREEAIKLNLSVDAFHNPIYPEKLEHLYIKELKICVVSENPLSAISKCDLDVINLNQCLNSTIIDEYYPVLKESKAYYKELLQVSLEMLKITKEIHDTLESFYIDAVNFKDIDDITEKIRCKIDKYI